MNSDLRSRKTQIALKFLQEITKFSSNPLLRTLTSESLTSFQLTLQKKKKSAFLHYLVCFCLTSSSPPPPPPLNLVVGDKMRSSLWRTWAMAMAQTHTKWKWQRKREIERWANLGLDSGYGLWRRSRCDGGIR